MRMKPFVQMKIKWKKLKLTRCSLFVNEQHPFLIATSDFLTACDYCGLGCDEVKCPIFMNNWRNTMEKNASLEKGDGVFHLKRYHNYLFQVRKQLFTVTNRKQCECVVCAIGPHREPQIVTECIYPDLMHWHNVAWSFLKGIYPPRDCGSLLHEEMYLAHEQSQWQWGMLLSGSTLHWGCYWNQG